MTVTLEELFFIGYSIMPQYKLSAISLSLQQDGTYSRTITVMLPNKTYQVLDFPGDKPLNRGQILKLIKDTFSCSPEDFIWPEYITIPEI